MRLLMGFIAWTVLWSVVGDAWATDAATAQWWKRRLNRFRYAPTSPVAVHQAFYLAEGQALVLAGGDLRAPVWRKVKSVPAGAVFAVRFADERFTVTWNSPVTVQRLLVWDPDTLESRWTPLSSPWPIQKTETLRVGDWPLHLSFHPPYGRVLIFKPLTQRPTDIQAFDLFPYNPRYRLRARLIPRQTQRVAWIETSRGLQTPMVEAGLLEFSWGGKTYRLRAFIEEGNDPSALFVIFQDATTGKTTYPLGRYVEAERQPDGTYLLDFNRAYVPLCAYDEAYNCPIPPRDNRLPFPIKAGERFMGYPSKSLQSSDTERAIPRQLAKPPLG